MAVGEEDMCEKCLKANTLVTVRIRVGANLGRKTREQDVLGNRGFEKFLYIPENQEGHTPAQQGHVLRTDLRRS